MLQEKFSKQPQAMAQVLATNAFDKEFLDRAVAVVEQHLDDFEFNMDSFASELGMARTKLFTKMKAIAGQTPYEFIMTYRLKKAAIMLKSSQELAISEISDRLGFSSPKYFTKCFKDRYHVAPLNYRKDD